MKRWPVRLAEALWSVEPSSAAKLGRLPLRPLGALYSLLMTLRQKASGSTVSYLARDRRPVISLGNLVQGGTGKTPLGLYLAQGLIDRGFSPGVVIRGYGGTVGEGPHLVRADDDPGLVGDEALLYTGIEGCLVVAGSDRTAGARLAAREGAEVILLDDGFQHLRLGRNLDLVLLDAAHPLGNGLVFPAGPLREPIPALNRASAFVLTRAEAGRATAETKARLETMFPGRPIFTARHRIDRIVDPTGETLDPSGQRILAAAGVARPAEVGESLKALDPVAVEVLNLADHQVYDPALVDLINARAKAVSADLIVSTAKDLPKLKPHLERFEKPLGVACLEMEIDQPERLWELIQEAAHGRGEIAGVLGRTPGPLPKTGRMLVVLPNWVGDALMATPVLENLRAALPEWRIELLLQPRLSPLFSADQRVDGLVEYDREGRHKGFSGQWRLAAEIRGRYDLGLSLTNSFSAAIILRWAGIPRRIGFSRDMRGLLLTDRPDFTRPIAKGPQVESYLGLLTYLGIPAPDRRLKLSLGPELHEWADGFLKDAGLGSDSLLIGICPGAAFGPSKAWPAERYGRAGKLLAEQTGARFLVFGGPAEPDRTRLITETIGAPAMDLGAKLSLGQTAALMARLKLNITNDSGLLHIGTAMGVPPVAIFGSTDPARVESSYAAGVHFWEPGECGPCYERVCPKEHECMAAIGVERVVEAALKLLARDRS